MVRAVVTTPWSGAGVDGDSFRVLVAREYPHSDCIVPERYNAWSGEPAEVLFVTEEETLARIEADPRFIVRRLD